MAGGAGMDIWRMGTNVNCSFLARRGHPSIYPFIYLCVLMHRHVLSLVQAGVTGITLEQQKIIINNENRNWQKEIVGGGLI